MEHPVHRLSAILALVLLEGVSLLPHPLRAQGSPSAPYLRDRGPGVPTSMFGTYIERGQLLVFPFVALTRDHNREYQPAKLGFGLDEDFRGKFRSAGALFYVAYGVTDWLAVEVEAARVTATLDKAPDDPTALPNRIQNTGVGDLEARVRLRVLQETTRRPEFFTFLDVIPATQRDKVLIAEPYWDLRPGVGLVRGFSWGTVQVRLAAEWNREAQSPDIGEVMVEYLKRLSPSVRVNVALEGGESGSNDEWTVVTGAHWRVARGIAVKLDTALGVMSKATDLESQLGVMFSFPH